MHKESVGIITEKQPDGQKETHRKTGGSAPVNISKARDSKNRGAAIQMDYTTRNNNSDSYTFQLLSFIC